VRDCIYVLCYIDEGTVFTLESYIKIPFLRRNGITLVKVYCVLINVETKRKRYIPYRLLFEGIIPTDKT
jgi:hypothetical protein